MVIQKDTTPMGLNVDLPKRFFAFLLRNLLYFHL